MKKIYLRIYTKTFKLEKVVETVGQAPIREDDTEKEVECFARQVLPNVEAHWEKICDESN